MAITLKVNPQNLKTAAQTLSSDIASVEKRWNRIGEVIRASKGYWEGDGSNTHQKYYQEASKDVEKILKRLKEHPVDLQKMAGVYDQTESKLSAAASSLPADVIV